MTADSNNSTTESTPLPSWKHVWRTGLAPLISADGLKALRDALANDDPRLLQGMTTSPPPLQVTSSWPVEAACAIGFAWWQGEHLESVAEVEEAFAKTCYECDQRMGEPAACRWFLSFTDDTPRDEMRALLLAEVRRTLAQREAPAS